MKKPEKICPGERACYRRWLKRVGRRLIRRAWRAFGEDAPRKLPHRGWSV